MSKLIECVPNFSEGQNKEVIEAIANAIRSTEGCTLLDVDPGQSTNRTVYTFVGSAQAVVEGAINAATIAFKLIDMTRHHGEHPRLGAMDVCPFIPVQNVTMDDCVDCANKFASRLAKELGLPSYLYGFASDRDYRKSIPQIRTGEYEALAEKLTKPEWQPNYGPSEFVASWGATLVGARKFLIAYNVNLLTTKEQAHRIALDIREQGRGAKQPGKFKCVQAIGWYLNEANLAQVSINITDHDITPVHNVFEEVTRIAKELNWPVVGSQIVGLVPMKAILQAAEFYMGRDNLFILDQDQQIRLVIERLGLNSVGPFIPDERIIDKQVSSTNDTSLVSMKVKEFVSSVGSRSPAPGGGSVAALVASLGAGLAAMAGLLTYGNKKFEALDSQIRTVLKPLYQNVKELLDFVDEDSNAFNQYMAALKLPKDSTEDKVIRDEGLEKALDHALNVPLQLARSCNLMWPVILQLATICNSQCLSDVQVGVKCLETAVFGAHVNVLANLKQVKDKETAVKVRTESELELENSRRSSDEILKILSDRYLNE